MGISTKRSNRIPVLFVFLVCSFFLWSSVLIFGVGQRHESKSLRGWGSDHYSHYSEAILFWHKGFSIYTTPVSSLCDGINSEGCVLKEREGKPPLAVNWTQLPRPYPLGVYLLHAPQAIGVNLGAKQSTLRILTILQYLLLAHVLVFLIIKDLFSADSRASWKQLTGYVILPVIYLECMRWSLSGFYDVIVVLTLWLSFKSHFLHRRPADAFIWYALSLSFGYRALWFAPVAVLAFYEFWQQKNKNNASLVKVLIALPLIALAMYGFVLYLPHLSEHPQTNPVYWKELFTDDSRPLAYAVPLAILGLYLGMQRMWLLLGFVLFQSVFAFTMIQTQRWHGLTLLPLFILPIATGKNRIQALFAVTAFFLIANHHVFKHNPLSGIIVSEVVKDLRHIPGGDVMRDCNMQHK